MTAFTSRSIVPPWRMSTLFLRTQREDPSEAEVDSHKLLVRAGYVKRAAPGVYMWLPLGLKALANLEKIVREEMISTRSQEVHFPPLLPREPYEQSNRWEEYGDNLFRLQDRKGADYLLAPTHEEMFTQLVKETLTSYKDFPLSIYQIQTKYRDEARPRAGLLRGREFVMKDSYSFDIDQVGLDKSYDVHREAYEKIFKRLGLEVVVVSAVSGAMGGSKSEEFLHPTEIGEDTFAISPGGFAANVEAIDTEIPPEVDSSKTPAAQVFQTPDSTTIDALVKVASEMFPDRTFTGADTLKNVVVKVISGRQNSESDNSDNDAEVKRLQPDQSPTEEQLVVIGLPGDRNVDMKRVEAHIGPLLNLGGEVDVEAASDEDLKNAKLVKGYIGPGNLNSDGQYLGTQGLTKIPYFIDSTVPVGSPWITGANRPQEHVFDLVAGRDFDWDGRIEASEVLEGDPAPDGSGPLKIKRGIELGHIFQLGTKYADIFDLNVQDENGKLQTITMGSYGLGITRTLAAIAEQYHDDKGLMWPAEIAPADVYIIIAGKDKSVLEYAEQLTEALSHQSIQVILDDRPRASMGVKISDAELLGIPMIAVIGKNLADGKIELIDRSTGDRENILTSDATQIIERRINERKTQAQERGETIDEA